MQSFDLNYKSYCFLLLNVKEPEWNACNDEAVWSYVAWHLADAGISSVLVGGGVVAIYTEGIYQSKDLDIVADDYRRKELATALSGIGFTKTKGRYFEHPDCHLVIEFPPGPVSLGEEDHITPDEREVHGKRLQLLSPTDCIKDRLCQYIHWDVRDCFEQALLVLKTHKKRVNLAELKRWCEREGKPSAYLELIKSLRHSDS